MHSNTSEPADFLRSNSEVATLIRSYDWVKTPVGPIDQWPSILIIDDEKTIRELMREVLEEAGYVALDAADGASGLKILRSSVRIDLLVTDVGLPGGMNGRQVADAGRIFRPNLKVLFIAGYAENATVGNGHLDPGMQVISKPFGMIDFANKVREMIEAN
jgi:CheY-like chemotaxis protein